MTVDHLVQEIFSRIGSEKDPEKRYEVTVSMIEIYNEVPWWLKKQEIVSSEQNAKTSLICFCFQQLPTHKDLSWP